MDISPWISIASISGLGLIAWGELKTKSANHSRNITSLWEKKGEAELLRKLETRVEGIDRWTREHEEKASHIRLQMAERFATLEQAINIGATHHNDIMRLVTKLEVLIEKMEKKFEERLKEVENAIERRNTP